MRAKAVVPVACVLLLAPASCGSRTGIGSPSLEVQAVDIALVSACARLVACSALQHYASVSQCVWGNVSPQQPERIVTSEFGRSTSTTCLNGARADCAAVRRCETGLVGACTTNAPRGSCSSSLVLECTNGMEYAEDCSVGGTTWGEDPGGTCVVGVDGTAECGFGACPGGGPNGYCDRNTMVRCENGIVQRETCGVGVCALGSDGLPECVGTGALCAQSHCDGNTYVDCTAGRESRIPCGDGPIPAVCGSDCYANPPSNPPCAPDAACIPSPRLSCDPLVHVDACAGTRLLYCDGTERTVDCAALGFGTCVGTPSGAVCR